MPIITWTNPVPMTYGTALSSNQLNAMANVPGSFVYSPTNGAVLNTGSNTLSVLFTPSDLVDYATAAATVSVVVQPAALTVTANNGTAVYGQPLPVLTGTIVGVTNGDDITAAYSTAATNGSPAGTYAIVPGLVDPNDSQTNYTVTLVSATLTISQATPIITWTNPAPITYGTALSSNQLNATANVPGSFVYNPTNGTVLNTGTNTLSVLFTPSDSVDYTNAAAMVSVVVQPAALTVTANNATAVYGQALPVLTGTITGVTNGDDMTAAYSTAATNGSPAGTYAIVPSLVDPNDSQTNYTVTLVSATLTISQAATIITWTNPRRSPTGRR